MPRQGLSDTSDHPTRDAVFATACDETDHVRLALVFLAVVVAGLLAGLTVCPIRGIGERLDGATLTPLPISPLLLSVTDLRDPLPVTWRLRYSIRIENVGTAPLYGLCISDTLPLGTYFLAADMGGIYSEGVVTWTVVSLAPGFPLEMQLELGTRAWLRGAVSNTVVVNVGGFSPVTVTESTTIVPSATAEGATLTPSTSASPTSTPSRTPTPSCTATLRVTPTPVPSPTLIPSPTATATPGQTRSPTPGLSATPRFPTAVQPTPGVASLPNLPPVLYVMLDFANGDWGNPNYSYSYVDSLGERRELRGRPEYGALGSWNEFYWDELNPHPGVYNWAKVDKYIRDAQSMEVTLPGGKVIPKPVGIAVATWTLHGDEERIGTNRTPLWVNRLYGVTLTSCYDPDGPEGPCRPFCTPNFGDPVWQYWFDQFVLAMGQHYDNNPEFHNLTWIAIATGVDEEAVERKNLGGCQYDVGNSPAFNNWVKRVMETYNRAFPHVPQFIQGSLEGLHQCAAWAATFDSRMTGVKANGLSIDHPNAEIRYDSVLVGGVTGFSHLFYQRIPTGFEPGIDPGVRGIYWLLMEGLYAHPHLIDVQLPFIAQAYEAQKLTGFPLLDFVRSHLGRTPENAPDVWIVLRETQHRDSCWWASSGVYKCFGPHYGDFEYWLYRREKAPGGRTVAIVGSAMAAELPETARAHVYSYHSMRRTDQRSGNPYMFFDIEDRYPHAGRTPRAASGSTVWIITVTFLNKGRDTLSLEYVDYAGRFVERRITKGPLLGPVDNWIDYTWRVDDGYFDNRLPGGVDFRIDCNFDGDEYIHRLIVRGEGLP